MKNYQKNYQISGKLLLALFKYFLDEDIPEWEHTQIVQTIRYELNQKLDSIIARDLFTKYKRAATPSEREQARKEYLDFKCINKDWRTETEVKNENL